ncbi:hypothetical protein M0805_000590 [Coniferiporia weirii]|nr:hypothetical protein M0805_000590 [Coniferiporia weirii]
MASSSSHQPRKTEERYGEGDTYLVLDLLPPKLADTAFERLFEEVQWDTMSHRGGEVPRLVAVEGEVAEDGSVPVYRHPADASPPLRPFSPTVERIRAHVAQLLGQPLNHALVQLYRHGGDYISEHSDKTIDVVRGSCIVNVSIGAQRTMTLRTKKDTKDTPSSLRTKKDSKHTPSSPRTKQSIPLPHNSAFIMGLATNAAWLHSIRPDRRPPTFKSAEETTHDGMRISLTFRTIGTFLSADGTRIWGQGATGKTHDDAHAVLGGGSERAEELLAAFGVENHASEFDWKAAYGCGFDVLHFT